MQAGEALRSNFWFTGASAKNTEHKRSQSLWHRTQAQPFFSTVRCAQQAIYRYLQLFLDISSTEHKRSRKLHRDFWFTGAKKLRLLFGAGYAYCSVLITFYHCDTYGLELKKKIGLKGGGLVPLEPPTRSAPASGQSVSVELTWFFCLTKFFCLTNVERLLLACL